MMYCRTEEIAALLAYIEAHLSEKLDLDTAARAAGYSKYHLHRMFTESVGLPLHSYIQRRRLTEAAALLVRTETPVLEIALAAGYESRQAFTTAFRAMYKQPPAEYRRQRRFYPLQLPCSPGVPASGGPLPEIACASAEDLPDWMAFVSLVIGGFPCLDEAAHREAVRGYIQRRQALVIREEGAVIGAAAFSPRTGSVDFLASHPLHRRRGISRALLDFLRRNALAGRALSVTTFREGDRADTGQRAEYLSLGFSGAELLTEFGYPTQRMVLPPEREVRRHG